MYNRKITFYEKHIKRFLDVLVSLSLLILCWWILLFVSLLVRIKMGKPVLFKQPRPGLIDSHTGKERIFLLMKFRTMSDETDSKGRLLPDEKRLGKFGRFLRSTSLDELPELFNILKGEMSFVGPRPQLVKDLVYMDDTIRMRHTARPGLTGLAQVMGRNAISWEEKFEWDLKYIENVTFINDFRIVLKTATGFIKGLFGKADSSETDVTYDFGDYLLMNKKITKDEYERAKEWAEELIQMKKS
jgi:lipopolysaccharide/colanic/teichoic acid biosynthesis glycosyltransferase